jgi:hypothetical protein
VPLTDWFDNFVKDLLAKRRGGKRNLATMAGIRATWPRRRSMKFVARHPWSLLSLACNLGSYAVCAILVQYLYAHGQWHPSRFGERGNWLEQIYGAGWLASFPLAIVALVREKQRAYGGVALLLAFLISIGHTV